MIMPKKGPVAASEHTMRSVASLCTSADSPIALGIVQWRSHSLFAHKTLCGRQNTGSICTFDRSGAQRATLFDSTDLVRADLNIVVHIIVSSLFLECEMCLPSPTTFVL